MREEASYRIHMREKRYHEQNGICVYCGTYVNISEASLDHIIPVDFLDEISDESNLVMCCKECNYYKGNHIVFTNLYDRIIYPSVPIPYVFRWSYIIKNFKDIKCLKNLISKNSKE